MPINTALCHVLLADMPAQMRDMNFGRDSHSSGSSSDGDEDWVLSGGFDPRRGRSRTLPAAQPPSVAQSSLSISMEPVMVRRPNLTITGSILQTAAGGTKSISWTAPPTAAEQREECGNDPGVDRNPR
ncbi:hypothetical protein AK812_SmicGene3991 [Symbiodinium microadriaticum]|uniref:Uncharacterized protein n=1 Tax=Symbiodinium microadriaticum TaxID=2951 RepID=A0A1Q9EXL2_SYMMI|nr:hypothetical protein AK812_SmicGene3991 [Symbiodinium microadriaticum]